MAFPTRPLRSRSCWCWTLLAVAVGAALLIIPLTALIAATRRPVFPAAPGTEAIVFRSRRSRPIDLYVIRLDGTHETRLTYLRAQSPE